MHELHWTTVRPTTTGRFWTRNVGQTFATTRLIVYRDGELRVCNDRPDEFGTPLKLFTSPVIQWSDKPIPEPV